jgi:signal transduction histidine kinase
MMYFFKNNGVFSGDELKPHGFQPEEIVKGFALSTIRERTEFSGGTFAVQSTQGKGAIIRASWPLAQ